MAGRSLTGNRRYDTTPNTTMPIMISVVMTGRRTKRPVKFIESPPASSAAASAAPTAAAFSTTASAPATAISASATSTTAAAAAAAARVIRATKPNRSIRRETRLPLGHDTIAVAHTARDDRKTARGAFNRNGSLASGVGVIHD